MFILRGYVLSLSLQKPHHLKFIEFYLRIHHRRMLVKLIVLFSTKGFRRKLSTLDPYYLKNTSAFMIVPTLEGLEKFDVEFSHLLIDQNILQFE